MLKDAIVYLCIFAVIFAPIWIPIAFLIWTKDDWPDDLPPPMD